MARKIRRILITGDKAFGDGGRAAFDAIRAQLHSLPLDVEVLCLATGSGAGSMAASLAKSDRFKHRVFRADFAKDGAGAATKAAEAALNADFDAVLVFGTGDDSPAAKLAIRGAFAKGREVRYVLPTGKLRVVKP